MNLGDVRHELLPDAAAEYAAARPQAQRIRSNSASACRKCSASSSLPCRTSSTAPATNSGSSRTLAGRCGRYPWPNTAKAEPDGHGEVGGAIARLGILGVHVSAVDIPIAIAEVDQWIRQGYRSYVTLTGIHGVIESVRDEAVRRAHNAAGLVLPDGMPLVWLLGHEGLAPLSASADQI